MDHVFPGYRRPPPGDLFGPIAREPMFLIAPRHGRRIILIAVVNNGLTVLNTFLQSTIEQGMILNFRGDMFPHVQRLSLAFHDRQRAGDLMFRINYSSAAVGEVPMMGPQLAQAPLTLVGMFLVVFARSRAWFVYDLGHACPVVRD